MDRATLSLMAAPQKTTDDRDVISQLAEKGEETFRQLVDRPRRMVDGAIHGLEDRLSDIAARLRKIDPLERRVAAIEKRVEALEKPAKTARSRPHVPSPRLSLRRRRKRGPSRRIPTTNRVVRATASLASANAMRSRRAANASPPGSRTYGVSPTGTTRPRPAPPDRASRGGGGPGRPTIRTSRNAASTLSPQFHQAARAMRGPPPRMMSAKQQMGRQPRGWRRRCLVLALRLSRLSRAYALQDGRSDAVARVARRRTIPL